MKIYSILEFPVDVISALERGEINLFEASNLARIKPGSNNLTKEKASEYRRDLLHSHLHARLSGARLRQRVGEILGVNQPQPSQPAQPIEHEEIAALEDFDPYDPSHLLWEEIKNLGFAFRDIKREELDDKLIEGRGTSLERPYKTSETKGS